MIVAQTKKPFFTGSRPWQESGLQSLLRVTGLVSRPCTNQCLIRLATGPSARMDSDPGRIRTCISWLHRRATPRGCSATNVCQNGKRVQCLIHWATGSGVRTLTGKATLAGLEPASLVRSDQRWSARANALSIRPQGQVQRCQERATHAQGNAMPWGLMRAERFELPTF